MGLFISADQGCQEIKAVCLGRARFGFILEILLDLL
jgi:hypothetical protein